MALLAGVASVLAFTLWFFAWYADWADYVLDFALSAALVAIAVGVWTAIRRGRTARFTGIVATALALLVIGYFVFIFLTYGDR